MRQDLSRVLRQKGILLRKLNNVGNFVKTNFGVTPFIADYAAVSYLFVDADGANGKGAPHGANCSMKGGSTSRSSFMGGYSIS